ncbi:MAG: class I SAM-dependent methyltransferase [Burkholderiales bacterium]|nr:class I SAM-dependent methyltransferase [Burkholderiales bacterium]
MNQPASLAARLPTCSATPAAAKLFLALLERISVGTLNLRTPSGETRHFGAHQQECAAELQINDWRACSTILKAGDIGLAEAYRNGWIDSPDFTALIRLAILNEAVLTSAFSGSLLGRIWYALLHRLRRNTRSGSRRNIHAHYDLGNRFYQLWLDNSWTYSSALFNGDFSQTLQSAQEAKYQRILDQLELRPGMRVLEIGCGWGGFAVYAAQRGVHVRGVTISPSQLEIAQGRARSSGLLPMIELSLCDYRDIEGTYDAVVSIEMFEAVGEAYWSQFFDVVRKCLSPSGQALVQTITIDDGRFPAYRASSDFIREFVFPGGMLPSPSIFGRVAANCGLHVVDAFRFGPDYAETLRRWRQAFESHLDDIRHQGFDEAFIRIWRLYYQYCEAGFDAGTIDVQQFRLRCLPQ